jgi:hypothetical protein
MSFSAKARIASALGCVLGCAAEGPAAPPISDITAPTLGAFAPGDQLAIRWTATAAFAPATLHVALVARAGTAAPIALIDGATRAASTTAPAPDGFTWGGEDQHGQPVPHGFYGLTVGDTATGATFDGGDLNIIAVVGAAFSDPAPGATLSVSASAPATLRFDTTAISTLTMTLIADPSPTDGDEQILAVLPIPGEIRTVGRDYAWAGTTMAGAAIAPGDYTIAALLDNGTTTWRVDGGTAHVTAP